MYTSGSTGVPKGVVLTHGNLIATSTSIMFLEPFYSDDVYIGYLPAAHVLELLSECTMMMFGIPVGYSSPNTMTDMSTKVMRDQKGDASVLKPTLMCVVPLILDRIYKNIIESVGKRGANFQKTFEFCYRYKLYWTRSGQPTPIVDKIVFNKIKSLLGGKMRFAITGGAPLSPETHDFIRVCLGLTLVQVHICVLFKIEFVRFEQCILEAL
jgi:long-chain acyl-CoA synthetase